MIKRFLYIPRSILMISISIQSLFVFAALATESDHHHSLVEILSTETQNCQFLGFATNFPIRIETSKDSKTKFTADFSGSDEWLDKVKSVMKQHGLIRLSGGKCMVLLNDFPSRFSIHSLVVSLPEGQKTEVSFPSN